MISLFEIAQSMNEVDTPMYKITYQDSTGRKKTDIMRAKNSNLAKRDFSASNKGRGFKILKVVKEGVNEVDDEKVIKYKKKDGESGEMKAGSAKSMPKDHPAKIAWDKMQDDGGDDSEKDSGDTLGGSDFDRDGSEDNNDKSDDVEISDANSGPIDTDDIMDMLKNDSEVVDKMGDDVYWDGMDLVSSKFDDDTIASIPDDSNVTLGDLKKQIMDYEGEDEDDDFNQDIIDPQGVDAIEAEEAVDYIQSNDLDADGIQNMWDSLQAKGYKHYDNNYRDVGKDIQKRIDYLKDGKGSDGFPMTSDVAEKKDKAKIGSLMQLFTKQHPLKKSDKKSESIKIIDGKKYKPIKESKKNPRILKEIYDRTFRSLK